MAATDLVEQLAAHKTLGSAPRRELEWLAAHGTMRHLEKDEVLTRAGVAFNVEGLYILLSGRIAIFVDRGSGTNKVMEWLGGDVTGTLPYSRMVTPPGDTVAQEPTNALLVPKDDFPEMIRECQEVTSILVHKMVDRARQFKSKDLQDERLISLGKLSAGLAHELNNPASAIERAAALLDQRLEEAEHAARALGAARLSDAQLTAVDALRSCCMNVRVPGVLSPIQQAEREDAISDWLEAHHLPDDIAGPLGETAVTIDALDQFAKAVNGPPLEAVLRWAAAGASVHALAAEVQNAAMRISGLVLSIKGFSHMDQATVAEPVDLALGLNNTVDVLRSKARTKSAAISVTVEPDLPKVLGFTGELNQIWANLIDNALDAVSQRGQIEIIAKRERQRVVVHIVDNGTGIAPEIQQHMFEPFFTTKPVGQGTGQGLDIVRRLVIHNDADINVESRPGRTDFSVSLPVADGGSGGARL
jgi:signal transduction histidine kinase